MEHQKSEKELEHLRGALREQQDRLESTRTQLAGEQKAQQTLKAQYDGIVRGLEEKVRQERDKREKLARTRVQKNEKLIEKFQQQMVDYEAEILRLKDNNEVMRLKSTNGPQPATAGGTVLAPTSASDKQVADLQALVKKRDQELVRLKEKDIKGTKERQELTSKATDAENKLADEKKKVAKYLREKDEALGSLRTARQQSEAERSAKERFKADLEQLIAEKRGTGAAGGLSYSDMASKLKELENDVYILEAQRKTVLALNPRTSAFEYIGEPVELNKAAELKSVAEIVQAMKDWLARPTNDRLSVLEIFESLDLANSGEVTLQSFESALGRLGLKLRPGETQLVKEVLDPRHVGYLRYRCLVRELQGVPQLDFMNKAVIKLAKVAESRDLGQSQFLSLVDPNNTTAMTIEQFQQSMAQCKAPDFNFDDAEVTSLFKNVTKAENRVVGVKLNTQQLATKVSEGVRAILIDQVRVALEKAGLSLGQLFAKYDKNSDGFLDHQELTRALSDCGLTLGAKMSGILLTEVLDPRGPNKSTSSGKISYGVLKFYLEAGGTQSTEGALLSRSRDQGDSGKGGVSDSVASAGGLPQDVLQGSKRAARKILVACHASIAELVGKLDHLEEGIVGREELKKAIEGQKVGDLDRDELGALLKGCDRGQRGYIAGSKFVEKLYSYAAETESETILRRLAKTLAHSDTSLQQEMQRYASTGSGRLDKATFKKCLKQLAVALSDAEIQKLVASATEGANSSPATRSEGEQIDIKRFCQQVNEAAKAKPLPSFVLQGAKGGSSLGGGRAGSGAGGALGAYEAEKKYKKNLEALKTEIEDKSREILGLRKEVKDCHDRYNRLDADKKNLEARLVDKHSKPPRETANEAQAHSQAQQLAQLREQLFAEQGENTKLRKTIEVTFKAEVSRLSAEKDQLEEKLRDTQDERARLQTQFNRLVGQPLGAIEKREALELSRQMRISDLERELEESEKARAEAQDSLFKADEKLLDLKFEKETFDLQYARLQKRIQELEQHKHSSAQRSATIRGEQEADLREIEEAAGTAAGSGKKKAKETVRLRAQGKSTGELEMLVESLKRVVEKLKIENEALKKENNRTVGQKDKVASEKAMKQKINNLEQLVHSLEMKEVNLDERDSTIKKLIQANKQLREDLSREVDRYILLEDKYKETAMKLETVAKNNKRNEELVFGMTTGGNMSRYQGFLSDNSKK